MELTDKQKELLNVYLKTGRCPDGTTRKNYKVLQQVMLKEHNRILENRQQDVYFIRSKELDRVKIGMTKNLQYILDGFQAGSPSKLDIWCVIEWMGRDLELHFHKKFAHLRLHNEWFKINDEMTDMVKDINNLQLKYNQ